IAQQTKDSKTVQITKGNKTVRPLNLQEIRKGQTVTITVRKDRMILVEEIKTAASQTTVDATIISTITIATNSIKKAKKAVSRRKRNRQFQHVNSVSYQKYWNIQKA
ncbi:hypothetical protein D931_01037, partial [Enterococcus faecium 13.SD.W.09]